MHIQYYQERVKKYDVFVIFGTFYYHGIVVEWIAMEMICLKKKVVLKHAIVYYASVPFQR